MTRRIYATNAERQKAYRIRQKLKQQSLPATTKQRIQAARQLGKPALTANIRPLKGLKYGNKPATLFISPLDHDEWVAKYFPRHRWKNSYLTIMSHKLWTAEKLLVFLPRGHGKTWRTVALICRWILEKRLSVLIITGGSANAKRIFRAIRARLKSPAIREDYGDVIGSFNMIERELTLIPELDTGEFDPVLRIATRGSEIVGAHPYWIHYEDLVQEPFKSDESNEALEEWHEGIVEFCVTAEEGKVTKFTGTGTRKDVGDFWEYLVKKLYYPSYVLKAIELIKGSYPSKENLTFHDDGSITVDHSMGEYKTLNCPAWPLPKLLSQQLLKPEKFRAEMQNDPVPKGGLYFSMDDWIEEKHTEITPDTRFCSFFISVDPSFGKSNRSDYTSIMVAALYNKRLFIVDGVYLKVADGLDGDKMIKEIVRLTNYWRPTAVYIESNNFQFLIAKQIMQYNTFLPVVEVTNVSNKIMRINSLKTYFVKSLIVCCPCQLTEGLKQEYIAYNQKPSTASRKDDALDSLEMIISRIAYHFVTRKREWKYGA